MRMCVEGYGGWTARAYTHSYFLKGNVRGAHVNFVPKYELQIVPTPNGFVISLDYYMSMFFFFLLVIVLVVIVVVC